MLVSEAMSRDVKTVAPDTTIREAAWLMGECDIGALPVSDGSRLAGMVTDRDIAVRAVAIGRGPDALVSDVMTLDVLYCHEDEDIGHVATNMADKQVRRLPVVNADKRLVGIISLADIADAQSDEAGEALEGITRRGGERSQSLEGRA